MRLNALAAVLAVNLALAGLLIFLWLDADRSRWPEPEALPPTLDAVAATQAAEPAEISRYRATLERPLFAATRKIGPRSDSPGEGQPAVDPLKDVRLLGTYGAGGKGGVLIDSGGKVQRVAVGASIGEWTVSGEDGRGAAFVRANGERRKLDLALNTVAPASTVAGGKAAASEAVATPVAQAPTADGAGAANRAQAVAARRAADQGAAGVVSDETREQLVRQRLERVNARRAQRGLPPLTE